MIVLANNMAEKDSDGINSLNYTLVGIEEEQFYTRIKVEIYPNAPIKIWHG